MAKNKKKKGQGPAAKKTQQNKQKGKGQQQYKQKGKGQQQNKQKGKGQQQNKQGGGGNDKPCKDGDKCPNDNCWFTHPRDKDNETWRKGWWKLLNSRLLVADSFSIAVMTAETQKHIEVHFRMLDKDGDGW
jgi:hypothetical protein